jgi:hypothetical protein
MLLCRVRPQHADDDVVREAPDESLASHEPHKDVGRGGRATVRAVTDSAGSM